MNKKIFYLGLRNLKGNFFTFFKNRIDFLIVGAQKCGTTALHNFLSKHPYISGSQRKEVNFFNMDNKYNKGYNYYHSFFECYNFDRLFFEASPSYLQDNNFVSVERIYNYNPSLKIIVILRDPLNRAFSAFNMYKKRHFEKPGWFEGWKSKGVYYTKRTDKDYSSFNCFIKNELDSLNRGYLIECPVLKHGKYSIGIEKYFEKFSRKNVLVLKTNDLKINTYDTLDNILKFLLIPDQYNSFKWPFENGKKIFSGKYIKDIDEESISILNNYYMPYKKKLYDLTGIKF